MSLENSTHPETPLIQCACCFEIAKNPIALDTGIPDPSFEFYVCEECGAGGVSDLFKQAVKYEHAYPPRWGNVLPEIGQFARFLPVGFKKRYTKRQVEYDTPKRLRVYCKQWRFKPLEDVEPSLQDSSKECTMLEKGVKPEGLTEECGEFLGVRSVCRAWSPLSCVACSTSSGLFTCAHCGEIAPASGRSPGKAYHECVPEKNDDNSAFDSLVRGKDYQICPKPDCGMRVELHSACNQLTCPGSCGTSFCMICGKEADHDSDHWRSGSKCPRFNQPGSEHAIFDGFQEADDDAETDDDVLIDWAVMVEGMNDGQRRIRAEREQWRTRAENERYFRDEENFYEAIDRWMTRAEERGFTLPDLANAHYLSQDVLTALVRIFEDRAVWRVAGMHADHEELARMTVDIDNFKAKWVEWRNAFRGNNFKFPVQAANILDKHMLETRAFALDIEARGQEDLSLDIATTHHPVNLGAIVARGVSEHTIDTLRDSSAHLHELIEANGVDAKDSERLLVMHKLFNTVLESMEEPDLDFAEAPIGEVCKWVARLQRNNERVKHYQRSFVIKEFSHFAGMGQAMQEYNAFFKAVVDCISERTMLHFERGWIR